MGHGERYDMLSRKAKVKEKEMKKSEKEDKIEERAAEIWHLDN